MSAALSNRRISWSKNTNYTSVASPKLPSEVGSHAHAPNKSVEQELETNKHRIDQMHRKSLVMMSGQRKLLEKSMLAYTEKMKEIHEKRTSELFREIQSRNGASSKSLPDIHRSPDPHDDVHHLLRVKKRHKMNSLENVHQASLSNATQKHSKGETCDTDESTKGKKPEFSKLRSLLRRSSTADMIDSMKLRQEIVIKKDSMKRFVSTQSLIETADYLDEYRHSIKPELKFEIFPKRKPKHRLNVETEGSRENIDSAYSSGVESHDEFSELDTLHVHVDSSEDNDSKSPVHKHSKKSFARKGGKVVKAKPKMIRKGRRLLKKMNTENNHSANSLLKTAVMSSASKHSNVDL